MNTSRKYKRRKVIAVDVDGTLLIKGRLNTKLLSNIKAMVNDGCTAFLWSARGEDYARSFAEKHGIADMFTHILSKPGYAFDDMGWKWLREVNTDLCKTHAN
jgi:hydroxymethylpyrimidine pyrophosphatase-like HAD family hydrolase